VRPGRGLRDGNTGHRRATACRVDGPRVWDRRIVGDDRPSEKQGTKGRVEITFENAVVEALPFPDAHFDVVLATLMLHHLPRKAREQGVREIRRVLRPGGRVLAVDFEGTERKKRGILSHLHRRHGHVKLPDLIAVLDNAGLRIVESGAVGVLDLNFVLATAPGRA